MRDTTDIGDVKRICAQIERGEFSQKIFAVQVTDILKKVKEYEKLLAELEPDNQNESDNSENFVTEETDYEYQYNTMRRLLSEIKNQTDDLKLPNKKLTQSRKRFDELRERFDSIEANSLAGKELLTGQWEEIDERLAFNSLIDGALHETNTGDDAVEKLNESLNFMERHIKVLEALIVNQKSDHGLPLEHPRVGPIITDYLVEVANNTTMDKDTFEQELNKIITGTLDIKLKHTPKYFRVTKMRHTTGQSMRESLSDINAALQQESTIDLQSKKFRPAEPIRNPPQPKTPKPSA
ncbi:MAG: hypothetical protein VX112_04210 [Pseudomonadota bacterium]|nr:hypothetical protein [Pseudomonadota bacterium]